MQLKDALGIAEALGLVGPEFEGFCRLADIYWDARIGGASGLTQEDVQPEHAEFLVELFEFDNAAGLYVHPLIEDLLNKRPAVKANTLPQFEEFWKLYPRKVAKANAKKSWLRLVKTDSQAQVVTKALRTQIAAQDWLSKDIQFIPHAATWLNQQRWEDEVEPQPGVATFVGVL